MVARKRIGSATIAQMCSKIAQLKPSDLVAKRLRDGRTRKGWSQKKLADAMTDAGWSIDRTTIAKIESGGSRALNLTLNEVLAFAIVLGMSPVFLMVPGEGEVNVELTTKLSLKTQDFRWWVSGEMYHRPLPARLPGETAQEHAARLRIRADWRFFEYMRPLTEEQSKGKK
jgi:transcriptional regulator with XRE-family HTH domain